MSEMRPINEGEKEALAALFSNAYRIGHLEAMGWTAGLPPEETIAVFEQDRIASFIRMARYTVMVGGREMNMGGVGGVATWADLQGRGFAGSLMRESLRIMRERGDSVSALYPFSHRYYGKFGWASMGTRILYKGVAQQNITPFKERSMVRRCTGIEDIERIDDVYRNYAARYNGLVIRDRGNWEKRINAIGEKSDEIYLVKQEGNATGYFICENVKQQQGEYENIVREFACNTPAAFRAMFGFLAALPTNVKKITLAAPAFPPLAEYFKEPFIDMKWSLPIQYRVVDLERALAKRGFDPDAKGCVVIAVNDDTAVWNTDTWEIEVGEGRAQARRTNEAAAVEMDIRGFSSLYMGHTAPLSLWRQGRLNCTKDTARLLQSLFHDNPVYLLDAF